MKIHTNVKEYLPHIKWILKKLRLTTGTICVVFLTMKDAKKVGIIPRAAKKWEAFFGTPNFIWINSKYINKYKFGVISILGHELRHYYQEKLKKFDGVARYHLPNDHRAWSKDEKQKYRMHPREKDAFQFQSWIMEQYWMDRDKGKVQF